MESCTGWRWTPKLAVILMPLNATYANLSNQRFVSQSVRLRIPPLGAVPSRQYDNVCSSGGEIEVGRFLSDSNY